MTMSRLASERNRNMISGAIGLVILLALITIGIKASFGAFDTGYELEGSFAAAGQGLLSGSDVKIRGMNIGEVDDIDLVENRARITMRIEDEFDIPVTAQAVVRPKTLFGEKFIDIIPGENELTGPYLADGGEIADTLGGFELERVLSDSFPVLEAIDPVELAVIVDELATAGDGLGETINRSIVNGATLAELQASNDAEIRQFLGDLALLSEELDALAPDLVAGARDLNVALPSLNQRSDQLNAALVQTARLASDVAELLEHNEEFTTNALTNGSRTLQVLFDRRGQIQPLLLGIQQYSQTLAEAIRVEVGDGTLMAAVKNLVSVSEIVGSDEPVLPELPKPSDLPLELPLDNPLPLDDLPLVPEAGEALEESTGPLLDLLFPGRDR